MKKLLLCLALLALLPLPARAQTSTLHGRIVNRKAGGGLPGVLVRLVDAADTAVVRHAVSNDKGAFEVSGLGRRAYRLEATRVGYAPLRRTVRVNAASFDAGDLVMTEDAIELPEIDVTGTPPPARQKADTTEFAAGAFRTNRDASAGELLAKVPGVTVENGTVKSNSETVQQVLVDGKPFFGGDPNIALHNLPAEAIDKIQIFDKLSEQAEFTGFDDGQAQKTINFKLRPERRDSEFGKVAAGHGDQGLYTAGGNLNMMHGDRRLSVVELSNNVNLQNFAAQDLLGVLNAPGQRGGMFGGGRRPGGGRGGVGGGFGGGPDGPGLLGNFLIGQPGGLTATHVLGGNYSDRWWNALQFNQSYFFNTTDTRNTESLARQYADRPDSVSLYGQATDSEGRNYNHRFESRVELTADSSNSLVLTPRLFFQSNHSSRSVSASNSAADGALLGQAVSASNSATAGNNLSGHAVLRHKFATRGRTVSADFGLGSNHRDGSSSLRSVADYFLPGRSVSDTLDQQTDILTRGYSLSTRLVYTEPVGSKGILEFHYAPSLSYTEADNRVHLLDPLAGAYTETDTGLSNTYSSRNTVHDAGLGYLARLGSVRLSANLAYRKSRLHGERTFPVNTVVDRDFHKVMPSFNAEYTLAQHAYWRVFYRTSASAPDISQLQDVVDNSNPLLLTSGNPRLNESYTHTFVSRYSTADPARSRSFFLVLSAQRTRDYVATSTVTAAADSVLTGGVVLKKGAQLAYPVNLDGHWNVNSFATYSLPTGLLGGILNLSTGYAYTRTPGLIGGAPNSAGTSTFSGGAVLSSNRSENLDFTVSYMGRYNVARNTLQTSLDNDYYSHAASVRLNLTLWSDVVVRNELASNVTSGLTSGYNQDILMWNAGVGLKFLKERRGELRLSATDLLNQNQSTSRTVTSNYVEDARNRALGRYVMLTFTYTIRPMMGGRMPRMPGMWRGEHGDRPGDGPPH
ncbi:MAG: TonB-dependent receptor [Candidatus Eisenbacteria bacterium]|nr:TonB-dependent receptor [Candidatus Eisenbacteria bacterium]